MWTTGVDLPNLASRRFTRTLTYAPMLLMLGSVAQTHANTAPMPANLLTPEQIEARLQAARLTTWQNPELPTATLTVSPNDTLATGDLLSHLNSSPLDEAGQTEPLSLLATSQDVPVSRILQSTTPIGLDTTHSTVTKNLRHPADNQVANTTQIPPEHLSDASKDMLANNHDISNITADEVINPEDFLPSYVADAHDDITQKDLHEAPDVPKKEGAVRKLYNKFFNDGVSKAPRLKVQILHADTNSETGETVKLERRKLKQEPYANIKAALEDVTQESVLDFNNALPRLRQTAMAAARAVGYYEVQLRIQKQKAGEIAVIIDQLGEPVRVEKSAVEVRGAGADNVAFQDVVDNKVLKTGDVFNHGQYEANKLAIEQVSGEQGFLDGRWLNSAADVILPDNTADVSLIYDSGEQYQFDEVVFFTIDPQTGEMTTDENKLPVKPELLKKLLNVKMGDAYNRQAVRDLNSDLLATGYFNTVNTEVIYPERKAAKEIAFENLEPKVESEVIVENIVLDEATVAQVAPLEFNTSQAIKDKLAQVTQKANNLYDAPENRLLPIDTDGENKSILARVSDAVKNIARVILPNESKDDLAVSANVGQAQLENKKQATQVYQDKKVPLYIFVVSDRPRDAHLGLGWGSDSGARFVSKFEHNLINRDGYQAGAEVRVSKNKKGVKLYASKPMSHPLNDKVQASLSYEEEGINQSSGFDLATRTLEQSLSRNIVSKNGWNRSYSLRYRLDELETRAPSRTWEDLPVNFISGNPTQEVLLAGFALHKTVADDLVNPLHGYRQQYSLEVGKKNLLSDTNLAIARAGVSGVYSFGDNAYGRARAHQFKGGLQAGYIWAQDFDAVPYKLRFFTGGDQSIRGYDYNSLAPVGYKHYLRGGQSMAVGNLEYNYELFKDLRVGVFSDIGGAYDANFGGAKTKIGAGVGVRWASPVGQLRVDVATGVNEKDNPIKLHFFIGAPF